MHSSQDEMLDVVDAEDRVTGALTRGEIHRKGLSHRSVHVFVVDDDGRLYLQRRAWTKDEHPGKWDASASGHVDSGESYDAAAVRELQEELGIEAPLKPLFKVPASPATDHEHSMLYLADRGSGRLHPKPEPTEILEGRFFTPEEIETLLARAPEAVTPSFRVLYGRFLGER